MHRFLFAVLIIVALTPALNAQEAEEGPSPLSVSYAVYFPQTELVHADGYMPLGSNIAGLSAFLFLTYDFDTSESGSDALRFGAGYINYEGAYWAGDAPSMISGNALMLPLEYVLRARLLETNNGSLGTSVAIGPYLAINTNQSYAGEGAATPRTENALMDTFCLGIGFEVGLSYELISGWGAELGYRYLLDQRWFDLSQVRWESSGAIFVIRGPLF